ncbi:class I SAM-dependent methyltransferase [Paenibacillus swuensis]|nr:class I SAM-dependent methyltransferase [Paenibacillus swuensis]
MFNPKTHPEWVRPHSIEWYAQLGSLTGQYSYPWKSTITTPNGEVIFANEVALMVPGMKVLDIGCGHGEFALQWTPVAKHLVGIDITEDFIHQGNQAGRSNATFLTVNTKGRLPFDNEEFDCAYNRRGPTSAYLDAKRIIKKGGKLIGLHPGDRSTSGLSELFPELYEPSPIGKPILDNLTERLKEGGLTQAEIETVRSMEYLHEPIDIVKMSVYGQKPLIYEMVLQESMSEITQIFEKNATERGLPITFERYIVRVTI